MPQKFQNRLKLGLWVILPLLLISFISRGVSNNHPSIDSGTYQLNSMGAVNTLLKGSTSFEEDEVISGKGRLLSTLKLNFRDNANPAKIPIQFLISVDPDEQSISTGTYNISRYISGFMNNFDGVFGYANLNMLGERPFFTRKGQLVITEKNNELVSGTLDVFLEAVNGESLHLQGSFRAIID